jgi:hypothetical protein
MRVTVRAVRSFSSARSPTEKAREHDVITELPGHYSENELGSLGYQYESLYASPPGCLAALFFRASRLLRRCRADSTRYSRTNPDSPYRWHFFRRAALPVMGFVRGNRARSAGKCERNGEGSVKNNSQTAKHRHARRVRCLVGWGMHTYRTLRDSRKLSYQIRAVIRQLFPLSLGFANSSPRPSLIQHTKATTAFRCGTHSI